MSVPSLDGPVVVAPSGAGFEVAGNSCGADVTTAFNLDGGTL